MAPSTEAPLTGGPFAPFAAVSFGSFLTGVFAVDAAPVFDLAYIVIEDPGQPLQLVASDGLVNVDLFVSGTKGGEIFDFQIGVPEPATMALLAIGGLGALIRRRK